MDLGTKVKVNYIKDPLHNSFCILKEGFLFCTIIVNMTLESKVKVKYI